MVSRKQLAIIVIVGTVLYLHSTTGVHSPAPTVYGKIGGMTAAFAVPTAITIIYNRITGGESSAQ